MKNKKKSVLLLIFCFCWLAACGSSEKWNGETYSGEITINGVKPDGAPVEKFALGKSKLPDGVKRFVKFDPANKILANCEVPIDDKYTSGVDEGNFFFVRQSAVCTSTVNGQKANLEIYSGSIDINRDGAKVSGVASVQGASRSYTFEIIAKP